MKKTLMLLMLAVMQFAFAQLSNISGSEQLRYRIHYGLLNAGTAVLTAQETRYQGVPHLYVKGVGRTTGPVRTFFKVEDVYESFINYETELPSYYVRNVKEGGYSQHLAVAFNQANQSLIITDKKNKTNPSKYIKTVRGLQDMLSVFYHLRAFSRSELQPGSVKNMNVWIDDEMFAFQLRVGSVETISSKYGNISCLKIYPSVLGGRVFKNKESVVLWVSNDANHVPISIKAELAVGSLKADLDGYSGVKYPLNFTK